MLWAICASALFSSNSWKPLPSRCNPFLYAKSILWPKVQKLGITWPRVQISESVCIVFWSAFCFRLSQNKARLSEKKSVSEVEPKNRILAEVAI
jgi:hypothetical protein